MYLHIFIASISFYFNAIQMKEPLVFDFGEGKDFGRWSIINDGVMGGLSESKAELSSDAILFSGTVSLKNNGGFVSLRSPLGNYDLSDFSFCEIRYKSDTDRKFELLIEKETPFYLPKYRKKFGEKSEDWQTLKIPLRDLEISRMGNTMAKGIDPEELDGIKRIGFILADKQEGSFEIWIDYLKFY
ncbi:MAG: carbohydrate-binding protein [Algoriphagus marincola HL-49]|uniref:Carbohydrate-binding protein n=1 Tax=Algoriphagus marincola HL-49 TaxID=1305737 RepID=A0A0P7YJI6_9BACT|nr:MAG: carbohydrate-binding protein [Algoriphagus marincola HL-49]